MSKLYVDNINPNSSWTGEEIAGNTVSPAGAVLQVIEKSNGDAVTTTSTGTWVDSGLELTITPASVSSKILLQAAWEVNVTATAGQGYRFTRNGTSLYDPVATHSVYSTGGSYQMPALQHLDAPNTTSAITYKLQLQGYNTNATAFNYLGHFRTSLIAMEIAG